MFPAADAQLNCQPTQEDGSARPDRSPVKGRRGRKKGVALIDDRSHLLAMLDLIITEEKSIYSAAQKIAKNRLGAKDHQLETHVRRLRKKFIRDFGPEPAMGETWAGMKQNLPSAYRNLAPI